MDHAIVADDLTVTKDHQTILDAISLSVQTGTLTGLIGPSGSGKTTLMRSIVGVQKLSGGTLTVLGRPAGAPELRRRIGYVTQSPAIYGDLTVEQNLRYFATLMSASRTQVDDLLDKTELTPYRSRMVDRLSGGQKARVSLAVALLGDPDLLVLDEPTVGLDPLLRESLWALFAELASQGKTLLVSSHVMDEAERCSQIILLRDGSVLWDDTRDALLKTTKTNDVGAAFMTMIERSAK